MSISARLKQLRVEKGLTQHQLGLLSGVKQQTIQRIESGSSSRPRNIIEISEALECSAKWLLYGTNDQKAKP